MEQSSHLLLQIWSLYIVRTNSISNILKLFLSCCIFHKIERPIKKSQTRVFWTTQLQRNALCGNHHCRNKWVGLHFQVLRQLFSGVSGDTSLRFSGMALINLFIPVLCYRQFLLLCQWMLWAGQSEKLKPGERFLVEGKTHSAVWKAMSRSVHSAFPPVCLLL